MGSNPVVLKRGGTETLISNGEEADAVDGDVIALIPSADSTHLKVIIKNSTPAQSPAKNSSAKTTTVKSPQPSPNPSPSQMKRKRSDLENEQEIVEKSPHQEKQELKKPKMDLNQKSPSPGKKGQIFNDPSNPLCQYGHTCYR